MPSTSTPMNERRLLTLIRRAIDAAPAPKLNLDEVLVAAHIDHAQACADWHELNRRMTTAFNELKLPVGMRTAVHRVLDLLANVVPFSPDPKDVERLELFVGMIELKLLDAYRRYRKEHSMKRVQLVHVTVDELFCALYRYLYSQFGLDTPRTASHIERILDAIDWTDADEPSVRRIRIAEADAAEKLKGQVDAVVLKNLLLPLDSQGTSHS